MCMSNYYVYLLSSKLKRKCTNLSRTVINLTSTSFPKKTGFFLRGIKNVQCCPSYLILVYYKVAKTFVTCHCYDEFI